MSKALILLLLAIIVAVLGIYFYFLSKPSKQSTQINNTALIKTSDIIDVKLTDTGFSPISVTIKTGQTVRWTNTSKKDATVNSNPHPAHNLNRFLNLGEFPPESSFQVTFEKAGTYNYHNHLNPRQQGIIIAK